LAGTISKDRV